MKVKFERLTLAHAIRFLKNSGGCQALILQRISALVNRLYYLSSVDISLRNHKSNRILYHFIHQ